MPAVLCIDFGTSSIRAAWRKYGGTVTSLPIGEVSGSRLDDASIRSEVHIDSTGRTVSFGERAWALGQQGAGSALYDSSPKLWLKGARTLGEKFVGNLSVSREDLLSGLIAFAIDASRRAAKASENELASAEIRIAHPVWSPTESPAACSALLRIASRGKKIVLKRSFPDQMSLEELESRVREADGSSHRAEDVVEPIAAAVELLPEQGNARRLCAIVDIGAGTTDIGLFQVVEPDPRTRVAGKLIQIGQPTSLFMAGNFLDQLVLEMLVASSSKHARRDARNEVERRIRQVKEALFRHGSVQELGVDLRVEELSRHEKAQKMATDIRDSLMKAVRQNERTVYLFLDAPTNRAASLEVVLAGGGASIPFIVGALSEPLKLDKRRVDVQLMPIPEVSHHGAGRGRMAVALGGANWRYETLIREMQSDGGLRRRGSI